ncbi:MAG: hypothetical protein QOJ35_1844 [Solirubrobacteraceae bacterium]|jgi:peptidoglycan/xylan/chitin deacetylase (PgdA/CDA1 family)|nr:hypothetical protein [Solirubrobacteraceae bacterium]
MSARAQLARRAVRRALRPPLARGLERVLRLTDLRAGVVLVYHEVVDGPAREPARAVTPVLTARVLSAHLRLLAARHRIVSAATLPAAAAQRRRGERFPVALTFDDDLRTHVDTALPRLRAAGATATFFLTGASLLGPSSFWWERLQRAIDAGLVSHDGDAMAAAARLQALVPAERAAASEDLLRRLGGELPDAGLRSEHVRELVSAGCEIGFHTRDHDVLTELDERELPRALRAGRDELEAATGGALRSIAYPHGVADDRVARAARVAGYDIGFTTTPAAVVADADPLLLGRLYPSARSSGDLAVQLTRCLWRAWRGHG